MMTSMELWRKKKEAQAAILQDADNCSQTELRWAISSFEASIVEDRVMLQVEDSYGYAMAWGSAQDARKLAALLERYAQALEVNVDTRTED